MNDVPESMKFDDRPVVWCLTLEELEAAVDSILLTGNRRVTLKFPPTLLFEAYDILQRLFPKEDPRGATLSQVPVQVQTEGQEGQEAQEAQEAQAPEAPEASEAAGATSEALVPFSQEDPIDAPAHSRRAQEEQEVETQASVQAQAKAQEAQVVRRPHRGLVYVIEQHGQKYWAMQDLGQVGTRLLWDFSFDDLADAELHARAGLDMILDPGEPPS